MTIMVLQSDVKSTVLSSQTKHTWSVINNVFKLVQLDYGTPGDNSEIFSETKDNKSINKELSKYLRNSIYCESSSHAEQCRSLKNYKLYYSTPVYSEDSVASTLNMYNRPLIILASGAIISISSQKNNCDDYEASGVSLNDDGTPKKDADGNTIYWNQVRSNCGTLTFDVNGTTGPNRMGVDAFQVNIFRNYLGASYWGSACGNTTLFNILKGSKYPFSYKTYD